MTAAVVYVLATAAPGAGCLARPRERVIVHRRQAVASMAILSDWNFFAVSTVSLRAIG